MGAFKAYQGLSTQAQDGGDRDALIKKLVEIAKRPDSYSSADSGAGGGVLRF